VKPTRAPGLPAVSLLACGLLLGVAGRAADKGKVDPALLEFLGSIDVEGDGWGEFLGIVDPEKPVQKPAQPAPPAGRKPTPAPTPVKEPVKGSGK
jgi:hypothetical protein